MDTPTKTPPTAWTGYVPVEDTALRVTDTGGDGIPVVYLNGSYANTRHWKRVITELGFTGTVHAATDQALAGHGLQRTTSASAGGSITYRHIAYDERARGRSRRSADYSFEATVRDLDAVLTARRIERPILVGWSYGALIAVHWADRHPDRVAGIVSVDGALPVPASIRKELPDDQIRKLFGRMRLFLPIAARLGLAARMSAEQHAEINIEANNLLEESQLVPILDRITTPVRYIIARGDHTGSKNDQMGRIRRALEPVVARNHNLQISARVPSNHQAILRKDSVAVAQVVRDQAAQLAG